VVERAAVAFGREEPEWDADQSREEHRADRQLEGRREPLADFLRDRAARRDARAEVSGADRLEVAPVLLVEGVVEAVLVADLRDRLVRRPLSQQRLRR
jgi:hypothetical protein